MRVQRQRVPACVLPCVSRRCGAGAEAAIVIWVWCGRRSSGVVVGVNVRGAMGDGVDEEGQAYKASEAPGQVLGLPAAAGARCHPGHATVTQSTLCLSRPYCSRRNQTRRRLERLQAHQVSQHTFAAAPVRGYAFPPRFRISHPRLRATFCTSDACEHDMIVNVCTPDTTVQPTLIGRGRGRGAGALLSAGASPDELGPSNDRPRWLGAQHLTQWLHLQPIESRAELWLQQNQHYRTRRNTNMQQRLTVLTALTCTQASSSGYKVDDSMTLVSSLAQTAVMDPYPHLALRGSSRSLGRRPPAAR